MRTRFSSVALPLALLAASTQAAATIEADNPARPFGYTIGDIVRQTVHVTPAPGQTLVETSLPREGRAGAWLERRAVVVTPEAGGWRIDLTYQFINVPTELRTVALPAIKLQLREPERTVAETLTESPVTLAPLTPAVVLARAGLEEMRPDVAPPLIDTRPHTRRLAAYALTAGLLATAWTAWYVGFGLRGRQNRPFARAERTLRRQLARDGAPAARREAMRTLHRAFDATAGSTLFAESLGAFFARCPSFAPSHDGVKRFFAASRAEFFGEGGAQSAYDTATLLALARQLKALEREAG
jgi:mxaA protein